MASENSFRPNPERGIEASREYALSYLATHSKENDTLDYRVGYAAHLLLDRLLPCGYDLLDVGCGTGGYHRLLRNFGHVIGLDYSSEMVAVANELKVRYKLDRVDYVVDRFEIYSPKRQFDAVSLIGTVGWYMPWPAHANFLVKAANLLKSEGLVCVSYVPPRKWIDFAKTLLVATKTIVIRKKALERLLGTAGFTSILELEFPHVSILIAQKLPSENV